MDKLKYIKLKNEDGSYTDSIPLAVDSDHVDVNGSTLTTKLGTLATKTEVQAVASGSPAGVYETVAALTTADPDHDKIYLVSADGHWYYYSNNTWTDGGTYQAAENSNTVNKLTTEVEMISEHTYNLWENNSEYSFTKLEDLILERALPIGTYTFSAEVVSSNTGTVSFVPYNINDGTSGTRQQLTPNTGNRISVTFTTTNITDRIVLYAGSSASDATGKTATYTDIQIVSGENDKPYEKFLIGYDKIARGNLNSKIDKNTFIAIGGKYNYWINGDVTSAKKVMMI